MYSVASKEDYVPPVSVKEKKKTKGGKLGNVENDATESADASATDEWSQQQQAS